MRTEEELAIDDRRFEALWPLTEGRRIDKVRHVVPLGDGLAAELDVYAAPHDGLLVAEVEFPSAEASDALRAARVARRARSPATRRYANQSLALGGRP